MDVIDAERRRYLKHRRLLYQYYRARLRDDQTTLSALRRRAEADLDLARAIANIEQALEQQRTVPPEGGPAEIVDHAQGVAQPHASNTPHDQPSAVADSGAEAPETTSGTTTDPSSDRPSREIFVERTGADYSTEVEYRLFASRGYLASGGRHHDVLAPGARREAALTNVLQLADDILNERMAPSQRLRALHMCANLARESRDYKRALGYIEDAVAISLRTGPLHVQITLLHLRGRIHRAMSHVRQAIEDFRVALAQYRNLPDEVRPPLSAQSTIELAILVELASMEFILALYPAAERHAAEATLKLAALPDSTSDASYFAARLEWVRALQHRWRGQPELALRPAAHALELLKPMKDASTIARLHVVIAEIALDMAERLPEGTDRLAIADLASTHVEPAWQLAHDSADEEALALAQIEDVRYGRLCRTNRDRIGPLEAVSRSGCEWGDSALQAQAFTALAQEMSTRNEPERALNLYRKALTLTVKNDVPALGVWAQRALLQASEMRGVP